VKKIPYTNNSKKIQHIGPCTIWPGQTREVDESYLDVSTENPDADFKKTDLSKNIEDILKLSVANLTKALPSLSPEDLDAVDTGEKSKNKPRIGVVNAIAVERVNRASQSLEGDKAADEFLALVSVMGDAELAEQDFPAESVFAVIVDAEKQRRAVDVFKADFAEFDAAELESLKADYAEQPDYLTAIDELIADKANS